MLNAAVHLGAAVLAGWALDRAWRGRAVGLAAGLLWLAAGEHHVPGAGWLYMAAVSGYSVALVDYAARSGRPGLVALVYGVAGWGGSAAGIMVMQGSEHLPTGLVAVAAIMLVIGLAGRHFASRRV
jgi:biotin transporter BioY